jgi:hypothetical protein
MNVRVGLMAAGWAPAGLPVARPFYCSWCQQVLLRGSQSASQQTWMIVRGSKHNNTSTVLHGAFGSRQPLVASSS